MTTVDKLLNQILTDTDVVAQKQLTQKDFDLLTSLNKIVNSEKYVTANQGYLIIRTLKENCRKLEKFTDEILNKLFREFFPKVAGKRHRGKLCGGCVVKMLQA